MRKVLLFLTLFLTAAMGVKAAPVEWSDGNGNSIKYDIHDNEVVIEVGNTNALDAFFAATDDDTKAKQNALKAATSNKFKVKKMGGHEAPAVELSAFDIAALNNLTQIAELDLSEATVGLSNMNGLALNNLQYLILPEGNSGVDMWNTIGKSEFKTQNPNLKMAASVTNVENETLPYVNGKNGTPTTQTKDTKKLALYSYAENGVQAFLGKYGNLANEIDKLDMAGLYGEYDLSTNATVSTPPKKVFNSNNLYYFDFTGATFSNGVSVSYTTKEKYNGQYDPYQNILANGQNITVTETNALAFLRNYKVMTCKLPTGNKEVPPGLFADDTNGQLLIEVEIPYGYEEIGVEAFYGSKINSLTIPGTMQNVREGAFYKSNRIVDVEMEPLVANCSFGQEAFSYCTGLKHFTMSEGVTSIPPQMFFQCHNLEFIRIPNTCTTIGELAFNLCISLHAVTIPTGVQEIKSQAFRLAALTDIYLLATDPADLPKLTPLTDRYNSDGGFGSFNAHQLWGNRTTAANPSRIANNHSDVVKTYYQEELSNGGYLGSGNCIIALHYPKELAAYLDAYRLDDSSQGTISSHYAYTDADGKKWPGQSDYEAYRYQPDGVGTEKTAAAWRQFALVSGDVENHSRLYDETWYTICFPWNVSDTQLFEAFNQKCEIVEFKGAEVIQSTKEENTYSLVLHFDEVAVAHYMDRSNNIYKRYDAGTYTVTSPVEVTYNIYRYVLLDDNGQETSTEVTFNKQNLADNVLYYQIENIMARAGHPYMIHPASVEFQGKASQCTIAGVRRVATTDEQLIALEEAGQVSRIATTGDATTSFTSPLGGGGTYSFKGFLGRNYNNETNVVGTDVSDIPQYSYFLAAPEGTKYPKYYREMANPATGKWTLYTAIITPDANAINNIEALNGAKVQNSANVAFGEWEQVEATAIEEIIADAKEKGQEVREVYMNVVYNINGQVVRTDGQIEGLPKGLYIVNGKKYVVK